MLEDTEVVIPTLFRPVTLEPLIEALREQGIDRITLHEDMPVNDSWRRAVVEAKRRYLMILNDDIEISPRFVNEVLYAHGLGGTFVYGCRVPRFTGQRHDPRDYAVRGVHLGEAFSLDTEVKYAPIPEVFKIYHGDDWHYFHHAKVGRCMEAVGAEYKTEASYSGKHPDINTYMQRWFGMDMEAVGRREHIASRDYFLIPNGVRWLMDEAGIDYAVTAMDTNRAFMGSAAGLKE